MPDIDSSVIETLELTPETLERLFGNETNYGDIEEDSGDGALFADGSRWSRCTSWANYVARVLGKRAQTFGFSDEENPDSLVASHFGGHDFSLVDGKFVVDGWLREVAGMSTRIVFDLENPEDAADIAKFYGAREQWDTSGLDPAHESPHMRELAMSSARFHEIIAELQAPTPRL